MMTRRTTCYVAVHSMGAGGHTGQAGCRATEPADDQKIWGATVIQGPLM